MRKPTFCSVTAFTVGVTTARDPACKRGIATNIAATLAREAAVSDRVCVVDADPSVRDVSVRLNVGGPRIEDFARPSKPAVSRLARMASPALAVLPCGDSPAARVRLGAEHALPDLREAFDFVVCDLPAGPVGVGSTIGARLEHLDWLVLAITPVPAAVAAARHFLEHFDTARDRRMLGDVKLAVVCTGDESASVLEPADVEAMLDVAVAGRIPQLWGRAEPNRGFGPALAIPELDNSVHDMFMSFRLGREHRPLTGRIMTRPGGVRAAARF